MDKIRHFAQVFSMTYCFHYLVYFEHMRYLSESSAWNFFGWLGENFILAAVFGIFIEQLQCELGDESVKFSWPDVISGCAGVIAAAIVIPAVGEVAWLFWAMLPVFVYTTYIGLKPLVLLIRKKLWKRK